MPEHIKNIDLNRCVGCARCVKDCPSGNIRMSEMKAEFVSQSCMNCGHCVAICPKGAVSMEGFDDEPVEAADFTALNPVKLMTALRFQRSVRHFLRHDIDQETIDEIIEAGRLTPTGRNAQDVRYYILDRKKDEAEQIAVRLFRRLVSAGKLVIPALRETNIDDRFFFKNAPLVILICADSTVDGSLAASNMMLMAQAKALGGFYSGFFTLAVKHSPKLKRLLNLKKEKPVTTLVLGYPAVEYFRSVQREKANVTVL